jgi:hypothetical protein
MRTTAFLVVAVGLLLAADAPKKETDKADGKLWAAISVNMPVRTWPTFTTDRFMLYFGLVNDGDKTVDPELESSQLLVNGNELKDWRFILSNGPRDDRWEALPPGDNLSFGIALGARFEKPGVYRVSWKGKGFKAPEIVFRVMPKDGK